MAEEATREQLRAAYDEHRAEVEKRNAAAMERMAAAKPTPTQRENDLARLGLLGAEDEKEADGTEEAPPRALEAQPDPLYKTRGPGRPRKNP